MLAVGVTQDWLFGPVIMFGFGGSIGTSSATAPTGYCRSPTSTSNG